MKKGITRLNKLLKLLEENVVFVVVTNHKFLINKWLKEKVLLKMQNASMDNDQL